MEVVQNESVHDPCHALFPLLGVFKMTAPEVLVQQLKVTGIKVRTVVKVRDIFMPISLSAQNFIA